MPLKADQLLKKKYLIEGEIGRGTFGRVYRARDTELDRLVAIKELHKAEAEMNSTKFADGLRRFEREARLMARFNHPHIVHVYEFLRIREGVMYLVMEYVDGGSLKQRLEVEGKLPIEEALRLVSEVLSGLKAVYADPRDIVHRDIKPSNILLTRQGNAKLTDFGLAQVGDESMRSNSDSNHPGTPAYMSPEQGGGSGYLYPASDLYSLGCVLFEMITGVGYKQAKRNGKTLRNLLPEVPQWLEDALMKVLVRDPDERPQTVEELADLLDGGRRSKEAQEKAQRAAEEEAQRQAQGEAEEKGRIEAERIKAQAAADEKVRIEAERIKSQAEAEEKARIEAERVRRQAESEEKARIEAERLRLQAAAEEKARHKAIVEPQAGTTRVREKDGAVMVYVPAGEFLMGSNDKDKDALSNEKPQHKVYLDDYWIDRTPVTNAMYRKAVEAGACTKPHDTKHYDDPKYRDHPVVYVDWNQAQAYCQWVGGILPSEAQWEKAARGTDGRIYPWGNQTPDKSLSNFGGNVGDTTSVGNYPKGASPYGSLDMAGNVWEWANDWYDGNYYQNSPVKNPRGADSGQYRVVRGGSWGMVSWALRSASRVRVLPINGVDHGGFRCVGFCS